MASTDQRIKKLEEQIIAIFVILDADKTEKIEEDKQKAIEIALAKFNLVGEQKRTKNKDKWIKLVWIPIVLLIVSAIVSWVSRLLPTGGM